MCIKKIIGLPISLLLFLPENNSPCLFALVWLLQWSRKSPQPHYSTFLPLLLSPDLAFFPGFEDLEDVDSPDVVESLTPLNPPYVVKNLDIEPHCPLHINPLPCVKLPQNMAAPFLSSSLFSLSTLVLLSIILVMLSPVTLGLGGTTQNLNWIQSSAWGKRERAGWPIFIQP